MKEKMASKFKDEVVKRELRDMDIEPKELDSLIPPNMDIDISRDIPYPDLLIKILCLKKQGGNQFSI